MPVAMSSEPGKTITQVIEREHGGTARLVGYELTTARWRDEVVWHGIVLMYALQGNAKAQIAYAWYAPAGEDQTRQLYTALKAGPIDSPLAAVSAAPQMTI
jgi:hypothetical protein